MDARSAEQHPYNRPYTCHECRARTCTPHAPYPYGAITGAHVSNASVGRYKNSRYRCRVSGVHYDVTMSMLPSRLGRQRVRLGRFSPLRYSRHPRTPPHASRYSRDPQIPYQGTRIPVGLPSQLQVRNICGVSLLYSQWLAVGVVDLFIGLSVEILPGPGVIHI